MALDFYWVGGNPGGGPYPWDTPANWLNGVGTPYGTDFPGSGGRTDDRVYFHDPAPGSNPMVSACTKGPNSTCRIQSVDEDGSTGWACTSNEFYVWGTAMGSITGHTGKVEVTSGIVVGSGGGVNHEYSPSYMILRDNAMVTHSAITRGDFYNNSYIGDPLTINLGYSTLTYGVFNDASQIKGACQIVTVQWNSTANPGIHDAEGILDFTSPCTIQLLRSLTWQATNPGGTPPDVLVDHLRRETTCLGQINLFGSTIYVRSKCPQAYGFGARGRRAGV